MCLRWLENRVSDVSREWFWIGWNAPLLKAVPCILMSVHDFEFLKFSWQTRVRQKTKNAPQSKLRRAKEQVVLI